MDESARTARGELSGPDAALLGLAARAHGGAAHALGLGGGAGCYEDVKMLLKMLHFERLQRAAARSLAIAPPPPPGAAAAHFHPHYGAPTQHGMMMPSYTS